MTAAVIPFACRGETKKNPYEVGSPLWLAYRQGADAQDEKWRNAFDWAVPAMTDHERLQRINELRHKAHWGDNYDVSRLPWPQTDADWRQTPHGAPWDANVHMAEWHLKFARKLQSEGLL